MPKRGLDPNRLPSRPVAPPFGGGAGPGGNHLFVDLDESAPAPRRNESAEKIRTRIAERVFGKGR